MYFEHSTHYRGFHGYLRVHVEKRRRAWFNELVKRFETAARVYLWEHNIASTIEVRGTFTTYTEVTDGRQVARRGSLAKVPRPRTVDKARRLVNSPTFGIANLETFLWEWDPADRPDFRLATKRSTPSPSSLNASATARGLTVSDEPNALRRMIDARLAFAHAHQRDPSDADELCDFYRDRWCADETHAARRQRAQWCLKRSNFDPTAARGGYARQRDRLLEAIRQHVRDEHRVAVPYPYGITDEDLVVALWVVTCASFDVPDDRRRRFGCPTSRFTAAFKMLKAAGDRLRS